MEYQIALSPAFPITAAEFADAWNEEEQCRAVAQATVSPAAPQGFPLDPEMIKSGLIFLAGAAGTMALDVVKSLVKDHLKKLIEKKFKQTAKPVPEFEVVIVDQPDTHLIVVREQN